MTVLHMLAYSVYVNLKAMVKKVLIKLAFDLVVGFICENAKLKHKPWVDEFCSFAKEVRATL